MVIVTNAKSFIKQRQNCHFIHMMKALTNYVLDLTLAKTQSSINSREWEYIIEKSEKRHERLRGICQELSSYPPSENTLYIARKRDPYYI
jgi:hypothetical protein